MVPINESTASVVVVVVVVVAVVVPVVWDRPSTIEPCHGRPIIVINRKKKALVWRQPKNKKTDMIIMRGEISLCLSLSRSLSVLLVHSLFLSESE